MNRVSLGEGIAACDVPQIGDVGPGQADQQSFVKLDAARNVYRRAANRVHDGSTWNTLTLKPGFEVFRTDRVANEEGKVR